MEEADAGLTVYHLLLRLKGEKDLFFFSSDTGEE